MALPHLAVSFSTHLVHMIVPLSVTCFSSARRPATSAPQATIAKTNMKAVFIELLLRKESQVNYPAARPGGFRFILGSRNLNRTPRKQAHHVVFRRKIYAP